MAITAGIDVGTGAVKTVLFKVEGEHLELAAQSDDAVLHEAGMARGDVQ